MRCELTTDSGATRLILVFAGWGTDATLYSHISVAGYDTMVVSGYSRLEFPSQVLDRYHTVCLFAWSLGVYAAAATLPFEKITMAIAVNGTEQPADDAFGIPESIYDGTGQSLNVRNLMKFRRRMSGESYFGIKERLAEIPIEELKGELAEIRRHSRTNTRHGKWDRAYISDGDAIFPSANQVRAWESHPSHPEIRHLEAPHYIDLFPVVKGAVPARTKVGERFRRALGTYDGNAGAQRSIAMRLVRLIPDRRIEKALEIGSGSGVFTSLFSGRFHPAEMDYIDLYPLPEYKAAPREGYHVGDAEEWMSSEACRRQDVYDAIVSASAIQWFANSGRFFANAFKLLKPGGVLACSSFLPGNLSELSSASPYGLVYRKEEELRDMLTTIGYSAVATEREELTLGFRSSRDVIRHIKDTGTGGTGEQATGLVALLKSIPPRLTYRPVYIIAVK